MDFLFWGIFGVVGIVFVLVIKELIRTDSIIGW